MKITKKIRTQNVVGYSEKAYDDTFLTGDWWGEISLFRKNDLNCLCHLKVDKRIS